MGVDILSDLLNNILYKDKNLIINDYVDILNFDTVFQCQDMINKYVGIDVEPLISLIFTYAFYLLILKFVWKCFNTYLLGIDGDEEMDPFVYIINFIKAIVISLSFGMLFQYVLQIASELTRKILNALKLKDAISITLTDPLNLGLIICMGIYTILAIVLSIMFVKSAIQLMILRIGISFAAVGILDSDGGAFKPYIKKFMQICFAVMIQVACFKISAISIASAFKNPISFIWAFSFISMALSAPAFLQEFIMTNPGNAGKIQQAIYSVSILRSMGGKR